MHGPASVGVVAVAAGGGVRQTGPGLARPFAALDQGDWESGHDSDESPAGLPAPLLCWNPGSGGCTRCLLPKWLDCERKLTGM